MRQQYHFRNSPEGLLVWDVFRLIDLSKGLQVKNILLINIQELDEAFWYDLGGARPTCRNVLEHADLINKADLTYPIIMCRDGRIMDGMHRVCKALLTGASTVKVVQFSEYIKPDYIGIDPDKLPY
ncbi:hypothetical protein [Photobacterium nomapromontoriensis]|uniref:hypothetical protein n=1 Tax=Photobacterium nomapromontoriensis TaxID=2910237 RepID=UPI003D0D44E6